MGTICCMRNSSLDLVNNYDDLNFIMESDIDLIDKQIIIKKSDTKVNLY